MASSKKTTDKKKQQRSKLEEFNYETCAYKIPEFEKHTNQLERDRASRLEKVQNIKRLELQSLREWAAAQEKQAWDEYYATRKQIRSDLIDEIEGKINTLREEKRLLKEQYTKNVQDLDDWVPPYGPDSISSFVGGASSEEIDHDFMYAKQRSNTPNLVYSDAESKSENTTEDSPSSRSTAEYGRWWPSSSTTA